MATTVTPEPVAISGPGQSSGIQFDERVERVLAQGRINLQLEMARLQSLGIIDSEGNRLTSELPADMQPGADRDFGG